MKNLSFQFICVSVSFRFRKFGRKSWTKFKSDARALELLAKARQTIGGEEAIKSVRSLSIKGKQNMTFKINGTEKTNKATLKSQCNYQIRFSKPIKMEGWWKYCTNCRKKTKNIVIVQKGEAANRWFWQRSNRRKRTKNVTVNVDTTNGQDGKVIIKNLTAQPEEVKLEGDGDTKVINTRRNKVVVKKVENEMLFSKRQTNANGQNVVVNKDVRVVHGRSGRTQQRIVSFNSYLLLSSPEGTDVSYTYVGEETVGGISAMQCMQL